MIWTVVVSLFSAFFAFIAMNACKHLLLLLMYKYNKVYCMCLLNRHTYMWIIYVIMICALYRILTGTPRGTNVNSCLHLFGIRFPRVERFLNELINILIQFILLA